jgi:hypothetical protein
MGPDKNYSPKRELSLCPKFTTKNLHTSLPRSRSHDGPPTLGTNSKQSQSESETQGAKDLATLRNTRKTVRKHLVDRPCGLGGLSAGPRRTIRKIVPESPVLHPQ